jgi:hypothetical protein
MPAHRLTTHPVHVHLYDVVGRDSPGSSDFVSHLGLATEPRLNVVVESHLRVTDMRPPLTADTADWPLQTMGTIPLTSDQCERVRVFLDEQSGEYFDRLVFGPRQYTIQPHVRRPTSDCSYHRYSCVGFVIEAYRDAGVELVEIDETQLPEVSLEQLKQAYPAQAESLERERIRFAYGLTGQGPWPVVLAWYVLHSLARSKIEIQTSPYLPQPGDECFPRRER